MQKTLPFSSLAASQGKQQGSTANEQVAPGLLQGANNGFAPDGESVNSNDAGAPPHLINNRFSFGMPSSAATPRPDFKQKEPEEMVNQGEAPAAAPQLDNNNKEKSQYLEGAKNVQPVSG